MKTFSLSERNAVIDFVNFTFERSRNSDFPVVVIEEDTQYNRIKAYAEHFANHEAARQYSAKKKTELKSPSLIYGPDGVCQSNTAIDWVN